MECFSANFKDEIRMFCSAIQLHFLCFWSLTITRLCETRFYGVEGKAGLICLVRKVEAAMGQRVLHDS